MRNNADPNANGWIKEGVRNLFPELVAWRRDFHRHPESGWTEYRTSAVLAERLQAWGWKVYMGRDVTHSEARMGVPGEDELQYCEQRAVQEGIRHIELMRGGYTGVVAEWDTGFSGPVMALRFDIDCNDLEESAEAGHLPADENFRSIHAGCMHACGHDGHMAIGLGVAKLIAQHSAKFKGKIRLLFQPAEEGSRGALAMVTKGWLDDVHYFLSGHIGIQSFELGEVVLNATDFYVTTKWDAEFKGVASHAGIKPELGRNALLAAATAALNIHAISRHHEGSSRINVGKLVAGSGRNIVPSQAILQLETRGATEAVNRYLSEEAVRILKAAADMYGVKVELRKMGEAGQASGNENLAGRLRTSLSNVSGIHHLRDTVPFGACEDVVHMMKRVQEKGGEATYMLFGSPLPATHHQPRFDFDERVMGLAVESYVNSILDLDQ